MRTSRCNDFNELPSVNATVENLSTVALTTHDGQCDEVERATRGDGEARVRRAMTPLVKAQDHIVLNARAVLGQSLATASAGRLGALNRKTLCFDGGLK
jgi:hypothetical protein